MKSENIKKASIIEIIKYLFIIYFSPFVFYFVSLLFKNLDSYEIIRKFAVILIPIIISISLSISFIYKHYQEKEGKKNYKVLINAVSTFFLSVICILYVIANILNHLFNYRDSNYFMVFLISIVVVPLIIIIVSRILNYKNNVSKKEIVSVGNMIGFVSLIGIFFCFIFKFVLAETLSDFSIFNMILEILFLGYVIIYPGYIAGLVNLNKENKSANLVKELIYLGLSIFVFIMYLIALFM